MQSNRSHYHHPPGGPQDDAEGDTQTLQTMIFPRSVSQVERKQPRFHNSLK